MSGGEVKNALKPTTRMTGWLLPLNRDNTPWARRTHYFYERPSVVRSFNNSLCGEWLAYRFSSAVEPEDAKRCATCERRVGRYTA